MSDLMYPKVYAVKKKKKSVNKMCLTCGILIDPKKSHYDERKFCSIKCANVTSWNRGTKGLFKHSDDAKKRIAAARSKGYRHMTASGYVMIGKSTHPRAYKGYVFEHIVVLERKIGRMLKTGEFVDHINGKRDDNRPENLRVANISQNTWNRGMDKRNKSGVKGVSWSKEDSVWIAQICKNRKHIHIGRFKKLSEAANAYQLKAKELFGDYAREGQV